MSPLQVSVLLLAVTSARCGPQTVDFVPVPIEELAGEQVRGAALMAAEPDRRPVLYAWGESLRSWTLPGGAANILVKSAGPGFGEGGCLLDVNQDGKDDLVLLEGNPTGRMVWLDGSNWKRHEIDSGAEFHDCAPAALFGRRGVLLVHRRIQVRFYEIPDELKKPWSYREIYSIYTPSQQGGLMAADVDGDGRDDILCGNYWIRSPERFELPWRLFAINLWSEKPLSAMVRLAAAPLLGTEFPELIVSQGEMSEARLAWFQRPHDPTQIWREHRLEGGLGLDHPHALAAGDFNGDGKPDLVAGENRGAGSRLLLFHNEQGGEFSPQLIGNTTGLLHVWAQDLDRDGRLDLVGAGPNVVMWWRNHLRR